MKTKIRFLTTRAHGFLDYITALLLLISPGVLGFFEYDMEAPIIWLVPACLGGFLVIIAFFTNYELGVIKALPMSLHLSLDFVAGIFLAASPWFFQFYDRIYVPHLLAGTFIFLVSLVSRQTPSKPHQRENPEVAGLLIRD